MGTYETAIDTIMVCFLEDEAENDKSGNISFASGPLKMFMSGKNVLYVQHTYSWYLQMRMPATH